MKKIKILLSVMVMLLVSGGVAWAVVKTINTDGTKSQTISGGTNINVANDNAGGHKISFVSLFTSGSVMFSQGASLSQDNSNFFWDNTNKRLGIGTNTPMTTVDVGGTVKATQLTTNTVSATSTNQSLSLNPTGTGKVLIGGESLVVARLTNQPASGSTSQVYFDRTLGKFRGFNGTSWVSFSAASSVANISVLVVAGGGPGGSDSPANPGGHGGGGAGGYQENTIITVIPQAYTITVGAGGIPNEPGGNSSAFGITSIGGGIGGILNVSGGTGGSGGGGGTGTPHAGGAGTITQGNNGGDGTSSGGGAGGGGVGAVGNNGSGNNGGNGGAGTASSISGSPVTRAGGGGGGAASSGVAGTGGAGGGGGTNGTANTGGGGGGSGGGNGVNTNGGSGVVIISYPTGSITATGGTMTTSGGNTTNTFTSSGTFTVISIN